MGLLDRLARIAPKGLDTHIFANSGSEVVENAIKMARAHTKKSNIICFDVSLLPTSAKVTGLGVFLGSTTLACVSQTSMLDNCRPLISLG